MHVDILRCDWCGHETQYDPQLYTHVKYVRHIIAWAHSQTEEYDLCLECRDAFSKLVLQRMQLQKVDAK